ncbi:MAG: DUF2442 domain-containing protein [Candidatus Omnitrophica bacterium]|nr:DUF2442 domain-containing protein [Candidatus Omnitrophota bacterium]
MYKIIEVNVLSDYNIRIKYSDGTEGTVNLSHLVGKGVFLLWDNYDEFKKVSIGSSGELLWGTQVDLCPDSLYLQITGKKPEDLFSNIKQVSIHA